MALELIRLGAAKQAQLVNLREITPTQLVEAYLAQIAALNPRINALVTLTAEPALRAARVIEEKLARGEDVGPLGGVPFIVKDTYDVAGVRSTYGSAIFGDHAPLRDAHVVRRLKASGAILLGRSNTAAFGFGLVTDNDLFGATKNPWDDSRISGGSSGGDAAAVAAGFAPLALASDLIGSGRIPAHYCGVAGFRPTPGLLSPQGHSKIGTPLLAELVAPALMARHVDDLALALAGARGYNYLDPFSRELATSDAAAFNVPGALRCAILDFGETLALDVSVIAALENAARELGRVSRTPLVPAAKLLPTMATLVGTGLADQIAAQTAGRYAADPRLSLVPHWTQNDLPALMEATGCRMEMTILARALLERFELLVLPVMPTAAPSVDTSTAPLLAQAVANYLPVLAGLPALAVPLGLDANGLPVAVQLVGRPGADSFVLSAGAHLQRTFHLDYAGADEA